MMKYQEVNVTQFRGYKETKLQRLLNDFIQAEIPVAELVWEQDEYRNPSSAYSAVKTAINRFKLGNIQVKVIEKRLYLFNTVLYEKALEEA